MKLLITEDDPIIFNAVKNAIANSNLDLRILQIGATCLYDYEEYLELIRSELPDIILLDQKLRWRNGLNKNAEEVLLEMPSLYYGVRKPAIILNSKSFHMELVDQFNASPESVLFLTPNVNLFLVTTQAILVSDRNETVGFKKIISSAIEYRKNHLPNDFHFTRNEILSIPGVRFHHYIDKSQPLNAINLYYDGFLCLIFTKNQRIGSILYFDNKGILNIFQIRFNLSISELKVILETKVLDAKVDRHIIYSSKYFPNRYLTSELFEVVRHTIRTANLLVEAEIIATAKQWGLI